MRFALFGDLHIASTDGRPEAGCPADPAAMPDFIRYADMETTVRKPLFELVRREEPSLLVSVGDLIEGGPGSEGDLERAEQAMKELAP